MNPPAFSENYVRRPESKKPGRKKVRLALLNAASLATAELCTNHIKTFFSLKTDAREN